MLPLRRWRTSTSPATLEEHEAKQSVEVVAPADLEGGYQFMVDAGTTPLLVRVPDEGVRAGQRFDAVSVSGGSNHSIPEYRWRDNLCDCCVFGWCHPTFCLPCWCNACALGQVLTRMKLNCLGTPLNGKIPKGSAFRVLFILTVMEFMVVTMLRFVPLVAVILNMYHQTREESEAQLKEAERFKQIALYIDVAFYIFYAIVTMRARAYIRQLYKIEEQRCVGCEDCCCAFWCNLCTIGQMARHTANYQRYPAICCSENGMAADAPDVV